MYVKPHEYHVRALECLVRALKQVPIFNYEVLPYYLDNGFLLVVGDKVIYEKTFKSVGELSFYFRTINRERARELKEALESYSPNKKYPRLR